MSDYRSAGSLWRNGDNSDVRGRKTEDRKTEDRNERASLASSLSFFPYDSRVEL
jgi:hypothetical protein